MRKQQKRFARILALVLAILLVLGTLASVLSATPTPRPPSRICAR